MPSEFEKFGEAFGVPALMEQFGGKGVLRIVPDGEEEEEECLCADDSFVPTSLDDCVVDLDGVQYSVDTCSGGCAVAINKQWALSWWGLLGECYWRRNDEPLCGGYLTIHTGYQYITGGSWIWVNATIHTSTMQGGPASSCRWQQTYGYGEGPACGRTVQIPHYSTTDWGVSVQCEFASSQPDISIILPSVS